MNSLLEGLHRGLLTRAEIRDQHPVLRKERKLRGHVVIVRHDHTITMPAVGSCRGERFQNLFSVRLISSVQLNNAHRPPIRRGVVR